MQLFYFLSVLILIKSVAPPLYDLPMRQVRHNYAFFTSAGSEKPKMVRDDEYNGSRYQLPLLPQTFCLRLCSCFQ